MCNTLYYRNDPQNDLYFIMYWLLRSFYCCVREITQILHKQAKVVAWSLNRSSHKFDEAHLATRNHAAQNGTQLRCPPYPFCLPVSTNAYLSCRKILCCLCVAILVHYGGRRHVGRFFVAQFRFPCFTRRIFIPCRLS
jgi:hypothetical protein